MNHYTLDGEAYNSVTANQKAFNDQKKLITDQLCAYSFWGSPAPLKPGDRVRVKEGYEHAGMVCFYDSKSAQDLNKVLCRTDDNLPFNILAEAIEPYPYSREERIMRAIEDYEELLGATAYSSDRRAALFAIMDAGV